MLTAIFAYADIGGWGYFLFGSIISVIIVWCFAPFMPHRTPMGAQERRKWEAFRNYLHDLTRFQDMGSAKDRLREVLGLRHRLRGGAAVGAALRRTERSLAHLVSPAHLPSRPIGGPVLRGTVGGGIGGGIGGGGMGGAGEAGLPGGGFSLDTISDGLFNSLGHMSSVLTSAPSSTGSGHGAFGGGGGFGGGGFGGGFSGGGGGGGFGAG